MTDPDWDHWQRVYNAIAAVESALWLDTGQRDANEKHAADEIHEHNMVAFKAIEGLRAIYPKEPTS